MKNLLIFLVAFAFACSGKVENSGNEMAASLENPVDTLIGLKVDMEAAIPMSELESTMGESTEMPNTVVSGKVKAVCQKKGCWMTLENENGEDVRVTFKDYALFMPLDISGREVVVRGVASKKTISVEDQRHYAEDAGKSEDEIAAITDPKYETSFEADGVIILN